MTLLAIAGFETRSLTKGWSTSNAPTYQTPGRFTSGYCMRPGSVAVTYGLTSAATKIFAGFGLLPGGLGNFFIIGGPSSATQMTLSIDAGGVVKAERGNTSIATSGGGLLTTSVWAYVEVEAKINDSGGLIKVRINGTEVLSFSGDTCNTGGDTTITSIGFPASITHFIDDFYICDDAGSAPYNTYLGDNRVETLIPNGNGNSSQMVGSDGNSTDNYLLVDEMPPSAADYVGTATSGNKDTYTFSNLVTASGAVLAVQVGANCLKSDAGVANMATLIRLSGTEQDSTQEALSASLAWISSGPKILDPASAAWTIANVNAAEFGVKAG